MISNSKVAKLIKDNEVLANKRGFYFGSTKFVNEYHK